MVSMISNMLYAFYMLGYIALTCCLLCISLLSLPVTLFMWMVEVTGRYCSVFLLSHEPKFDCIHRRRLLKIASRRNKQMRKQLRPTRKLLGRYFIMWLRVFTFLRCCAMVWFTYAIFKVFVAIIVTIYFLVIFKVFAGCCMLVYPIFFDFGS